MLEEYVELCKKVERIDAKAAKYLREEAPKLESFMMIGILTLCFHWIETPQGWEYWNTISQSLGESE
jgi:hypothetical protein